YIDDPCLSATMSFPPAAICFPDSTTPSSHAKAIYTLFISLLTNYCGIYHKNPVIFPQNPHLSAAYLPYPAVHLSVIRLLYQSECTIWVVTDVLPATA
ncbi:hypothetical protein, partial [Faecalibaculum rodentium]|uniref:hypothetical protein n=1 Tax=Faecalibaculum rodentium TaxID=1702221 RepID=UPI00256F1869